MLNTSHSMPGDETTINRRPKLNQSNEEFIINKFKPHKHADTSKFDQRLS